MLQRTTISLVLLISGLAGTVRAADNWPQFRGPTGQGISDATDVPVRWNATTNIAWSANVPGHGWSSPVLAGGRVYLTTAIGEAGKSASLHALCIDAENGKTIWDVEVFQGERGQTRMMHGKNSLASATPIVSGDRVYVHFGHMGTAALDLAGNVLWRQSEIKYMAVHGNGGSPILVNGNLIFSCDGAASPFIIALDANSGQIKWKTPRNATVQKYFSFSTPLAIEVDGTTQVISPASGFVGAYNPEDGHEIWRVRYGEGYSVVPRPIFAHGLLFLSSGFDSPVSYAVRPAGAKGDATDTNVAWTSRKAAPCTPSMLVAGDEVYAVSDGGIATCADARTGKLHWTHRLDGGFSASPFLAEGRIYYQSEAGVGYVVKAGKTFELLAENDLGERSLASVAVTDRALFIRTDSHLWKIKKVE